MSEEITLRKQLLRAIPTGIIALLLGYLTARGYIPLWITIPVVIIWLVFYVWLLDFVKQRRRNRRGGQQ